MICLSQTDMYSDVQKIPINTFIMEGEKVKITWECKKSVSRYISIKIDGGSIPLPQNKRDQQNLKICEYSIHLVQNEKKIERFCMSSDTLVSGRHFNISGLEYLEIRR